MLPLSTTLNPRYAGSRRHWSPAPAGISLALALTGSLPLSAATLTDVVAFSANANGAYESHQAWNTRGPEFFWNAWISPGAPGEVPDGLTTPFLNGPGDQQAAIAIPLHSGTNRFTIFAQPGAASSFPFLGLNLFINGQTVPALSAVTPVRLGQAIPAMAPNASTATLDPVGKAVPGSGQLQVETDSETIELTECNWASPEVFALDRVMGTLGTPGGQSDFVGAFTLVVKPKHPLLSIRISEVEICWESLSDERYQVLYRSELTTNQWLPLGPEVIGTGTRLCVRDAAPPNELRRFYNIVTASAP